MHSCGHLAEFFRTDEELIERVVAFMQEGFETDCACIAVVTPQHQAKIADSLRARGLSEDALIAAYRYIVLDAQTMLDSIRREGKLDAAEFHRSFGQLISLAASGGRHVRLVGEMVTLLANEADSAGVIQLEEVWNDLSRVYPFTLLCAYPMAVFESSLSPQSLLQVRALHSRVRHSA